MKPKIGRPTLPPGRARSERLVLRFTPSEFKAVQRAAARAGTPISTWIAATAAGVARDIDLFVDDGKVPSE